MAKICIFFDFESTGLSCYEDEAVQWACVASLKANKSASFVDLELPFKKYIKPLSKKMSAKATEITGIKDKVLSTANNFGHVLKCWVTWLRTIQTNLTDNSVNSLSRVDNVDSIEGKEDINPSDEQILTNDETTKELVKIPNVKKISPIVEKTELWLIAHNGFPFDFPLLWSECLRHNIDIKRVLSKCSVTTLFDTLGIMRNRKKVKKTRNKNKTGNSTGANSVGGNSLGEVYKRCFKKDLKNAHDALADVTALRDLVTTGYLPLPTHEGHSVDGFNLIYKNRRIAWLEKKKKQCLLSQSGSKSKSKSNTNYDISTSSSSSPCSSSSSSSSSSSTASALTSTLTASSPLACTLASTFPPNNYINKTASTIPPITLSNNYEHKDSNGKDKLTLSKKASLMLKKQKLKADRDDLNLQKTKKQKMGGV